MSQEELAHRAGLSSVTISNVENAVYGTSLLHLADIAKALGVPVVELIYGKLENLDIRLYESFTNAAKLDDAKRKMICNVVNQILQGLEETK